MFADFFNSCYRSNALKLPPRWDLSVRKNVIDGAHAAQKAYWCLILFRIVIMLNDSYARPEVKVVANAVSVVITLHYW
jgi:hypothetical protein